MNSVIKISVVLNQPVMKQSSGSTDNWMTMPVVTLISGKQMRFVIPKQLDSEAEPQTFCVFPET